MHCIRNSLLILLLIAISRVTIAFEVSPGMSGGWFDPSHDGEGYVLQVNSDNTAVIYWFTYDAQGRQQWILGVGEISGSKINFTDMIAPVGGRFGPKFDPSDVDQQIWGDLVLDFADCSTGTATYSGPSGFGSGKLNIKRLVGLWGVGCDGQVSINPVGNDRFLNTGFSGSWFDQSHDGEGFTVDVINETTALIYWFTYDTLGNQAWMFGVGDIQGGSIVVSNLQRPTGGRFGANFDPDEVVFNDWGPAVFTFGSCSSGAMRYVPPDNFGIESTQTLKRISGIKGVDCKFLTETHNITGSISVAENTFIDGDINDPNWPETSNDLQGGEPQKLASPATVVGYATSEPTGVAGDRFEKENDEWDTYIVSLKRGEAINLYISDWLPHDPQSVDLDLYLISAEDFDAEDINLLFLADSSLSTNRMEQVSAPEDGDYIVAVWALLGTSNYLLKTGQSADAQSQKITVAVPMAEGEIIAAINYRNSLHASQQRESTAQRVAALEKQLGLVRLNSAADGHVHYRARHVQIDTLTPHPLTRHGLAAVSSVDWMVARLVKKLQHNPDYQWAGLNYRAQTQVVPNDLLYSRQWHYPAIRLPQAWDVTTGDSSVIVAVLDSGIYEHTDLVANVDYSNGFDFVTDEFDAADGDGLDPDASDPGEAFPLLEPYLSHGTHVAGTIGASSNNGTGVAGVAWDVTLMPVRVIGVEGGDCSDINNGMKWAGRLPNDSHDFPDRRADVINMSFRSFAPCTGSQTIIDQLNSQGIIVIAAAGNDATSSPVYPAALNGVFSVSATGVGDYFAPYSNSGSSVDLAAPGGDVTTDRNRDGYPDGVWSTGMQVDEGTWTPYQTFHNFQGTSMAAPHVAGVAALMKSVNPALGPAGFEAALAGGELTVDLGPKGKDAKFGYGRIDALASVRWAQANAGNGQEVTRVTSSLSALDFGARGESFNLEVSKVGSDALSVDKGKTTDSWIELTAVSVDTNNFGSYRVTVNRTGLPDGHYAGAAGFVASDGTTLWVAVSMRVGKAVVGTAGYLYGLLLDEWTLQNISQWQGAPLGEDYELNINNVIPGAYYLVVGTDMDNDGSLCDPGEFCQFYPSSGDPSQIEIMTGDFDIPVFILVPPAPIGTVTNSQAASFNQANSAVDQISPEILKLLMQGVKRR